MDFVHKENKSRENNKTFMFFFKELAAYIHKASNVILFEWNKLEARL